MWCPVTRNLLVLSCGVCLFAASGCSVLRSGVQDAFAAEAPRPRPAVEEASSTNTPPADPLATADEGTKDASDAPSCYVEIRASGKEPKKIRMSLDDATHVQKVLEHTGLVKQFRNMYIELSRKLPDSSRHKLEVRYDAKRNHVISAFDYALHPDDLLVVRQDSSTSFDRMLKKLAGPLAR
ncbi:MAG: hypothetical protein QGF59_18750 [Pirellulaceae bacterium]|jgi:hypothetical protein|nr:hypothetical protein [Pirellulaceae bacterium]MDP6720710.1 hypothetical protein [Pirellulaceae bacterium]